MNAWTSRSRVTCLIATGVALVLAACSESDRPDNPVIIDPPIAGIDTVAVSLFVTLPNGAQQLRWVGDENGPLPGSPEQSQLPWIGFGVPFELRWVVGSEQAPIVGYRWKASQFESAPFVPAAIDSVPEWNSETRAIFSNDTDPGMLGAPTCFDGPDCPSLRRWGSSFNEPYRFQLEAVDQGGRVQHFEFAFHVNYPPDTRLLRNELVEGHSGVPYPRYWYFDSQRNWVATHIAEGDTIPSGAYAVFAVEGSDRLASTTQSDSFCCDLALGPNAADIRRQWRAEAAAPNDRGDLRELLALWTPPAVVDTTGFFVGPFDYRLSARAVDEHERRDPTPESLDFVGGFAPRITSILPGDGDVLWVSASGVDPRSTVAATVVPGVTRYWDPSLDEYFDVHLGGTDPVTGTLITAALRMSSAADPRQHGVVGDVTGRMLGGVGLSWAYRYRSENDPENLVREGRGDGDLREFTGGSSSGGILVSDAIEIFVPSALWGQPDLYDPAGNCVVPEFCDQGQALLRSLGEIALEVVVKDTQVGSFFSLYTPGLRPEVGGFGTSVDLSELGRRSDAQTVRFQVRLVLGESGGQPILWPAGP